MSEEEPTGRDLHVIWKTVTVVAVVVAACIGSIMYGVTEWVRLVTRIEAVEKWQAQKEKEAARELWRRDRERERQPAFSPGIEPRN